MRQILEGLAQKWDIIDLIIKNLNEYLSVLRENKKNNNSATDCRKFQHKDNIAYRLKLLEFLCTLENINIKLSITTD